MTKENKIWVKIQWLFARFLFKIGLINRILKDLIFR